MAGRRDESSPNETGTSMTSLSTLSLTFGRRWGLNQFITNVSRDADHLLGRRHIEDASALLICIDPPSSAPESPVIASPGVQQALSGVNRPSCDLCSQGACEAGPKLRIG
jgi:hypothetical protein